MNKALWLDELKSNVNKELDKYIKRHGNTNETTPSIKYGILERMYFSEPLDIEITKELAYDELATMYAEEDWEFAREGKI